MTKSQHEVLNPYTLDAAAHSDKHGFQTVGESMTVQADVEQSDINTIVKQFGLTNGLPYGKLEPFYADISNFPTDFQDAQNFVLASQEAFMTLPAETRSRFQNSPHQFLEFIHNNDNRDEAIKLGFIPPPEPIIDPAKPGDNPQE